MKPSEIIREYGWTRNQATGNNDAYVLETPLEDCGGFCMNGAIFRSAFIQNGNRYHNLFKIRRELDAIVRENLPTTKRKYIDPIAVWNDARGRTKGEVIAKLEEVGL